MYQILCHQRAIVGLTCCKLPVIQLRKGLQTGGGGGGEKKEEKGAGPYGGAGKKRA